jgi:putative endonuclease
MIAGHYLELAGFTIVDRNVQLSRMEIDLVARRGQLLCFVEVRLRRRSRFGTAVETVDHAKRRHLRRAAALYLARHPASHCRFDLVTIDWRPGDGLRLRHLENILQ